MASRGRDSSPGFLGLATQAAPNTCTFELEVDELARNRVAGAPSSITELASVAPARTDVESLVQPDLLMSPRSPEYDRPPVHETVLGVQFDPLQGPLTAQMGVFLASLSPRWTLSGEAPPIGQVGPIEFEGAWAPSALQLQLGGSPSLRLRAEDESRSRLLQLENGWFVLNWRAIAEGAQYPRYQSLKEQFDGLLSEWKQFALAHGLGDVRPNLWEVSYVNFVDQVSGLWSSVSEWPSVLPNLLGPAAPSTVGPLRTFEGEWHFSIPPDARLQIDVQHRARSGTGEGETMVVRLMARGPVDMERSESLTEGMSRGHEAIVHTFGEIASTRAREHWGYRP